MVAWSHIYLYTDLCPCHILSVRTLNLTEFTSIRKTDSEALAGVMDEMKSWLASNKDISILDTTIECHAHEEGSLATAKIFYSLVESE